MRVPLHGQRAWRLVLDWLGQRSDIAAMFAEAALISEEHLRGSNTATKMLV
jgi:hypothetical protein